MTEEEARYWLTETIDVPRETLDRIGSFIALLRTENERQNLVSRSTLDEVWSRHIADSAQLSALAPQEGNWIDLGTGAGFPGLIVALLRTGPVTLVEQRRLRAGFLDEAVKLLGLESRVTVLCANAAQLKIGPFEVISARAFAPLERLLDVGMHLAAEKTRWVLPKGRNAKSELEAARASWQGIFRLEPSLTDPDASIIVAEQVRRGGKGTRLR